MTGQIFKTRQAQPFVCLNCQTTLSDNSDVWKGNLSLYFDIFLSEQ